MKFKKIPSDYFVVILDRLTRFEPASVRYKRVFDDIISKFLIDKKCDLDLNMVAVDIINNSCENLQNSFFINDILTDLEKKYFKDDEVSYQYLSYRLNFDGMLNEIKNIDNLQKNVAWLKSINNSQNLENTREEKNLLYPIEKIILCEGQTEYVLLSTILRIFGLDTDKLGLYVLPAGGKNQVARKFYNMLEYCNLPFFILLDKDAMQIKELIKPKMREIDKLYLLKSGEFEDIIPISLLKKTINLIHSNDFNCNDDDFRQEESMVKNLEIIYRKYGFGEFKKAYFAQSLREVIEKYATMEDFKNSEMTNIVTTLQGNLKNIK